MRAKAGEQKVPVEGLKRTPFWQQTRLRQELGPEIVGTFKVGDVEKMNKVERLSDGGMHDGTVCWGYFGPKSRSPLFSEASRLPYPSGSPTLIRVKGH